MLAGLRERTIWDVGSGCAMVPCAGSLALSPVFTETHRSLAGVTHVGRTTGDQVDLGWFIYKHSSPGRLIHSLENMSILDGKSILSLRNTR